VLTIDQTRVTRSGSYTQVFDLSGEVMMIVG